VGCDLTSANLRNANLSGANLQGANLSKANLFGARVDAKGLADAHLDFTVLPDGDCQSHARNSRSPLPVANLMSYTRLSNAVKQQQLPPSEFVARLGDRSAQQAVPASQPLT